MKSVNHLCSSYTYPVLQLVRGTPTPASAQRAILAAGVVCQHLPAIVAPMKEGREREEGEGREGESKGTRKERGSGGRKAEEREEEWE